MGVEFPPFIHEETDSYTGQLTAQGHIAEGDEAGINLDLSTFPTTAHASKIAFPRVCPCDRSTVHTKGPLLHSYRQAKHSRKSCLRCLTMFNPAVLLTHFSKKTSLSSPHMPPDT